MIKGQTFSVSQYADIISARQFAKLLADDLGFDESNQEEISIIVTELSTNLIKHAIRGKLSIMPGMHNGNRGVMIISEDDGPGFDFEEALKDGMSTRNTLGFGLGAINRLSHELEYGKKHQNSVGSQIICKKWLKPKTYVPIKSTREKVDIGVVTSPKPGQTVNGDQIIILNEENTTLVAVIDGVGHGIFAHKAACAAKQYVESHSILPIKSIFHGVERACYATNGVVMALALINWSSMKLVFGSIGNINARIGNNDEKFDLIVRRGILGRHAPDPYISEGNWKLGMSLVLHSDGLTSQWNWSSYTQYLQKPSQFIAEQMFRDLHSENDDATLVFVK